ncbi:MAG: hypothetical protein GTO02_02220, partial [Candidatus Dadabacteria bacterium]|nr:hypothetical protein [Candidatus Dadabacteria bacterium]
MTNKEYYADHSWIKVKRHKDDESKSWEDRYYALDDHHVKETTFLINEIRTLAEKLDTVEIKDKKKERTKECIRSFFVFWFG